MIGTIYNDLVNDVKRVKSEVEHTLTPTRERSLVITKLDDAILWIYATAGADPDIGDWGVNL